MTADRTLHLEPAPSDDHPAPETEAPRSPPIETAWIETDIAILADFRLGDETAWRIEAETRIQAQSGYRTAFIHLAGAAAGDDAVVNPILAACVAEGIARVVDPGRSLVRARLLVLHRPEQLYDRLLAGGVEPVPKILADRVIAVADQPPGFDPARKDGLFKSLFGSEVTWASTGVPPAAAVAFEAEPWRPATWALPGPVVQPPPRARPVVGCIVTPAEDGKTTLPPVVGDAVLRALVLPGAGPVPPPWDAIDAQDMDPVKFVAGLDFLVAGPEARPPVHIIAQALMRGVPTILPPELRPVFGNGPRYLGGAEAAATIQRLHKDPAARRRVSLETARHARHGLGPDIHRARLARLTGLEPKPVRAPRPAGAGWVKPVLFVSANGVGLGHLTRLLAIARRCPKFIAPVFACFGQAVSVVEQAGFPAEYLPFHSYAGCDPGDWNDWLDRQLGQMLDATGARAVVFDGSTLFDGMVRAVGRRRDCRLVWVRRAMWRKAQANDPLIARQRFCDLVIEPSDIAEAVDAGITVAQRHLALVTPPIRLLDPDELPDREAAAARLGLDPARPAVLIQLGAGANRDIVDLIDAVVAALSVYPEVQPLIADWLTVPGAPDLWPGIKRLRGFPFSRYLRAFDFTVSAAGYNSFHEIISFGLPAIFLPNDHAAMDDQVGRAAFAQQEGCAFHLDAGEREALPALVATLLDPKVRHLLRANCRRLERPNGAAEAAGAIAALVG